MALIAGCGAGSVRSTAAQTPSSHAVSAPKDSSTPAPSTHVVQAGPYTITVPRNWTVGRQIQLNTLTASGDHAALLMPNTLVSNNNGFVSPQNVSPFFSEQLNGVVSGIALQVTELTANGTYYELTVTAPTGANAQLKAAEKTLRTPPPATVTQDAHLIQEQAKAPHPGLYATTARVGTHDQWVLVGGSPATAQEPFALYRSTTGGRYWTLADYTTFRGRSNFLGLEGLPSITFWNAEDGIIAESSSFAQSVSISYTTDGGLRWQAATVPQVGEPTGKTAPIITRKTNGTLEVTTRVFPNKVVTLQSTDNGHQWLDISAPSPRPAATARIAYTAQQRMQIAHLGIRLGFPHVFAPEQGVGTTFHNVTAYRTSPAPSYPVITLTYSNFTAQEASTADALPSGGNHTIQPVTFTLPGIGPVSGTWSLVYGHYSNTPQSSVLQFPISGMVVQMDTTRTTLSESQMVQIAKSYRAF